MKTYPSLSININYDFITKFIKDEQSSNGGCDQVLLLDAGFVINV
jgi:hypothetical protein